MDAESIRSTIERFARLVPEKLGAIVGKTLVRNVRGIADDRIDAVLEPEVLHRSKEITLAHRTRCQDRDARRSAA